jgi:hypothetical protein
MLYYLAITESQEQLPALSKINPNRNYVSY